MVYILITISSTNFINKCSSKVTIYITKNYRSVACIDVLNLKTDNIE